MPGERGSADPALFNGGRVELDQPNAVQTVFGGHNEGLRKIVRRGDDLTALLRPGQKFPDKGSWEILFWSKIRSLFL